MFTSQSDPKSVRDTIRQLVIECGPTVAATVLGAELHRRAVTTDEAMCIFGDALFHAVEGWDERHRILGLVVAGIPLGQWKRKDDGGETAVLSVHFYAEEWEAIAETDRFGRPKAVKTTSVRRIPFFLEELFAEMRRDGEL